MKIIKINESNLRDEELDYVVIRVKCILENSKGQILIAHNNNTYQLPGGHLEKGEELTSTMEREIQEETGIDVKISSAPFLQIASYEKDYFKSGKKVKNVLYYYRVLTDEMPNKKNTKYDEVEQATEFNLYYIKRENSINFINKSIEEHTMDEGIGKEMKLVFNEYNLLYGGK